jgi:hypothetical protein
MTPETGCYDDGASAKGIMALVTLDGSLADVMVTGIYEDAIRFMAHAHRMYVTERCVQSAG